MNGHVFQMLAEQKKKNQSNKTLDELKTFASQKYVKHINYLTPLFTDLVQPYILEPVLKATEKIKVTLADGTKKEIDNTDPFELE